MTIKKTLSFAVNAGHDCYGGDEIQMKNMIKPNDTLHNKTVKYDDQLSICEYAEVIIINIIHNT